MASWRRSRVPSVPSRKWEDRRTEREWTFTPTSEEGKPKRKDEKFQERQGSRTGNRGRSDGSGQNAGDDATGEAVNWDLTIPERALARETVRWPSATTNHETGRWKGQTTST